MAGNFQPYLFNPYGLGVYAPVRQTAVKGMGGLLPPHVASKLYARRHAKPNVFASTITSRYNVSNIEPSEFSQYGRGKARIIRNKGITYGPDYHPTYGGSVSDPLMISLKGGKRTKKIGKGTQIATRNAVINPGSY